MKIFVFISKRSKWYTGGGGFVLARYWMFIQVYYHKDRRLFDYYLSSFLREYLLCSVIKNGKYPEDLNKYLELDDCIIERAIREYAKKEEESDICYFADKLYRRAHHKVVFDPPYVHYNVKDEEQSEAYRRISYVDQNVKKLYQGNRDVYVDLAKGSTAKHIFDIKVYNEESDPDYKAEGPYTKEMPAIPVISKHDGEIRPIQDYSFTLRSISDRNISILRVYAEEGMSAEVQAKCNYWYTDEYTDKIMYLKEVRKKENELREALKKTTQEKETLEKELNK